MNTVILQKCIAELNVPEPRLDYLRGMLETLLEMSPKEATAQHIKGILGPSLVPLNAPFPSTAAGIPAPDLNTIKKMAGEI